MKIFVDTNIFLDILFKRENYEASLSLFKAVKYRVFDGVVQDISIVNIAYVSRKVEVDTREYLSLIERHFTVLGADNAVVQDALLLKNDNIEDNIQYLLALYSECDCIVSNDRGFYRGDVEVWVVVHLWKSIWREKVDVTTKLNCKFSLENLLVPRFC